MLLHGPGLGLVWALGSAQFKSIPNSRVPNCRSRKQDDEAQRCIYPKEWRYALVTSAYPIHAVRHRKRYAVSHGVDRIRGVTSAQGQAGLIKPLPANNGSQRTRRSQDERNIRDQPGQGVARFLPAGPGVVLFVDSYYM